MLSVPSRRMRHAFCCLNKDLYWKQTSQEQIHQSTTDTVLSDTESALPPVIPNSKLLCFTRKTKNICFSIERNKNPTWLRFLKCHHILQSSHSSYCWIFSSVSPSQVTMEINTFQKEKSLQWKYWHLELPNLVIKDIVYGTETTG